MVAVGNDTSDTMSIDPEWPMDTETFNAMNLSGAPGLEHEKELD